MGKFTRRDAVIIENPVNKITKDLLRNLASNLLLTEAKRNSEFSDVMRIGELRKSCGVEPEKSTIKLHRYTPFNDKEEG